MIRWYVSVNNNQYIYIVDALSAGQACTIAGDKWHADERVTNRQRAGGIYAVSARLGRFGDTNS